MLFNRHLFFLSISCCAWLALYTGRRWAGEVGGRVVAAFVFGFSYFNIPALSYNTMGSLFLFAGVFLLLAEAAPSPPGGSYRRIGAANLCWFAMAFAYPTLVVASAFGVLVSLSLAWKATKAGHPHVMAAWSATVLAGGAAGGLFAILVGVEAVRAVLEYATSYGYAAEGSTWSKAKLVLTQACSLTGTLVLVGCWCVLPLLTSRWLRAEPRVLAMLAFLVGGACIVLGLQSSSWLGFPTAATPWFLVMGLFLPVLAVISLRRSSLKDFLLVAALPCFIAAALVTWSSTNGLVSSTIGLFPAAAAGVVLMVARARAVDAEIGEAGGGRLAASTVLLAWLAVFSAISLLATSYRDEARLGMAGLSFASGPYAGILTTRARADKVDVLATDFSRLALSGATLFTPDAFPAAFLFSSMRPRTHSVWPFWSGDVDRDVVRLRGVIADPQRAPDLVLRLESGASWIETELERAGYQTTLERSQFGYVFLGRVSVLERRAAEE